jgi:malate dehydrogenase (oxaloacetate-decarboxylating)(NADP+)
MANPDPEITPEEVALIRDDVIIATGRSDYPNQVNNVLGFPYIFRGALDVRATTINMEMKIAAAQALAELARRTCRTRSRRPTRARAPASGADYIIPVPFDPRLIHTVPPAVSKAAMDTGVARRPIVDVRAYKAQLSARRDPVAGTSTASSSACASSPKRVVFAEGEEEQVIRAALSFVNQGLGTAISVGREDRIARPRLRGHRPRRAARASRSTTPARRTATASTRSSSTSACSARASCSRLPAPHQPGPQPLRASMVALGDADAMVTGATRNYSTRSPTCSA